MQLEGKAGPHETLAPLEAALMARAVGRASPQVRTRSGPSMSSAPKVCSAQLMPSRMSSGLLQSLGPGSAGAMSRVSGALREQRGGKTAVAVAFGPQMWPGPLTTGATDPAWGGAQPSNAWGSTGKVESMAPSRKFSLTEHED